MPEHESSPPDMTGVHEKPESLGSEPTTILAPQEISPVPPGPAAPVVAPTGPAMKEGGLPGWSTVFGAFFGNFATFGQLNSFGSFQAYYTTHQLAAYSPSDISWIGSLQLWSFFFSGLFVGRLFDAYGPFSYYQFILAQGILFGIGTGFVFYPCVSSTQTHFVRLRATASSISVAGSSAGGIVFPLMLQALFPEVGFSWAVRITGFVCLACGLIASVCCTSRLPPRKPGPLLDTSSFKDAKFMSFALGSSLVCLGLFVPFFYVAQFAEEKIHTSASRAFDIIAVLNAGSVLGRPIPGLFADALGRYNLIVPCAAISGILCLTVWILSDNFASITSFAAFYGFFSGAVISLTPPCIAQISQLPQIGRRVGLAYTMMSFSSLVSGPIAGAILTGQQGSYDGLIAFAGTSLLVGAVAMGFTKVLINRNILAKV